MTRQASFPPSHRSKKSIRNPWNISGRVFALLIYLLHLVGGSARPVNAQAGTVTFAAFGDYGINSAGELAVANLVNGWNPDFIVTTGDNTYGSAAPVSPAVSTIDQNIGKYYHDYIGNYAGGFPPGSAVNRFFPAIGNHEYTDGGGSAAYFNYFTLPGNERYYDFVQGPVHFFMIDSNPAGTGSAPGDGRSPASVQAAWLQAQLAASTSPWKIVVFHHPAFSSSSSHGSDAAMQWPFEAWGATAVLTGHDHDYERILRDDNGNGVSMPYFVSGAGGTPLYGFGTPVPGSAVRYSSNFGSLRVQASNTSITFEFWSVAGGGTLIDSYTIDDPSLPTATATSTTAGATTLNFQYGASGYTGTLDTFLRGTTEGNTNFNTNTNLEWDDNSGTTTDEVTLIRFTNLFTSEGGPIPNGATITSASLTYMTTNLNSGSTAFGDPANVYESLVNWTGSTVTHNNFGGEAGVQADEYNPTLIASAPATALSTQYTINVTASLQRWSDGTANYGWIFLPSASDGVNLYSSDDATISNRPRLSVTFTTGGTSPTNTATTTPTNTATATSSATFTPVNTATHTSTSTATITPSQTPTSIPTQNSAMILLSPAGSGTAGTVTFADEDILVTENGSGVWSLYFDGSDVGLGGTDVDALAMLSDGSMLLSTDTALSVGSLGTVDDSDIIRFIPGSLGGATTGTFEWYFDGSDVGLTTNNEDIDALDFAPDGRLVISTIDSVSVSGATGVDEDLLAFSATSLGSTTAGAWSLYFDGSDVGLADLATEDIGGVWIDPSNGRIYLNTLGAFSVTGVSGDGSDIFICTPGTLGSTTSCTYDANLYWDGSANGFAGQVVDGLEIVLSAGGATSTPSATAIPTNTFTSTPTFTATASATPSRTGTPVPTSSPTMAVTNTQTPTPTGTPIPPTATHTGTATNTVTPLPPTATATPTNTPTSTPAPTNTPTATSGSSGFPSTNVLDAFNRANGAIGAGWSGYNSSFTISSNHLDVSSSGWNTYLLWNSSSFGTSQEAYVTLTQIDAATNNEQSLILKSQSSTTAEGGMIYVMYDGLGHIVQVWTYSSAQDWVQRGANIPVTLVNGDQFGARAKSNGMVEVYRNGILLGSRDASGWTYSANGGYIGLWFVNSPDALLDNFGGGATTP